MWENQSLNAYRVAYIQRNCCETSNTKLLQWFRFVMLFRNDIACFPELLIHWLVIHVFCQRWRVVLSARALACSPDRAIYSTVEFGTNSLEVTSGLNLQKLGVVLWNIFFVVVLITGRFSNAVCCHQIKLHGHYLKQRSNCASLFLQDLCSVNIYCSFLLPYALYI